jgi:tRNA-specific 2-thiouridylase
MPELRPTAPPSGRVLVAMSGGVDSSVTAALLHDAGYDVVGITMKTWDHATTGGKAEARERRAEAEKTGKQIGCCTVESMNDARRVAVERGFPHFVVDIREEFGGAVIERFTSEYLAGRTPNPCVLCNTHIKWDALLRRADDLGCDYIATGHYARVGQDEATGRYVLQRGLDDSKDQSYALWGLPQHHLARSLFPLGAYTKDRIREMADEQGLQHVAQKPDSYEICFIPDDDYRTFLTKRVDGLQDRVAGGPFVWEPTGETVGQHKGYPFYTVGQRRGIGIGLGHLTGGKPAYVTRIDAERNVVYVGPQESLLGRRLVARQLNFVAAADFLEERRVVAQIRYNDRGAPALVRQTGPDEVEVVFESPRAAIAPGQACVLYDEQGEQVLMGGWIEEAPSDVETSPDFISLPLAS